MTTTIFKMEEDIGKMASDSRVTWVDDDGHIKRVFDSPDYYKITKINGVLYGFAGTNAMYKILLMAHDKLVNDSNTVMDTLVELGKADRVQFSFLRYDGELRQFAYSPPSIGNNEIYLTSNSAPLLTKNYAIGSGKHSRSYAKFKNTPKVQLPIYKIIAANKKVLNKSRFKSIASKVGKQDFTVDESQQISSECHFKGGDIFTGGVVRIMERATESISTLEAKAQVKLLDQFDQQAKSNGFVCASPINAETEIKNLQVLGIEPVDAKGIDPKIKETDLYKEMREILHNSV